MNKTLLSVSVVFLWLAATSTAQTRELTTRTAAQGAQPVQLSAINSSGSEMKSQSRGGHGSDCESRIHYKEVLKYMMDEKVVELTVKVLGGESRTFKYPFAKGEIRDGGVFTVQSENGMMTIDLCGVYMIERRGQLVEIWLQRED